MANLDPVLLAGTTVRRATLHNAEQMALLDIRPGDMVYVEKGGEIIPKITGVELSERPAGSRPFSYIDRCPELSLIHILAYSDEKSFTRGVKPSASRL